MQYLGRHRSARARQRSNECSHPREVTHRTESCRDSIIRPVMTITVARLASRPGPVSNIACSPSSTATGSGPAFPTVACSSLVKVRTRSPYVVPGSLRRNSALYGKATRASRRWDMPDETAAHCTDHLHAITSRLVRPSISTAVSSACSQSWRAGSWGLGPPKGQWDSPCPAPP